MATFAFQKPTDQPTGKHRLLSELQDNLRSRVFNEWWIIVAFAKVGPLLRLEGEIRNWRTAGGAIHAIFGIDEQGTSFEALEFALNYFTDSAIVHYGNSGLRPTFHPKIYLFAGKRAAVGYVGSNNLTVGGTETNLEAHIRLAMDLPKDRGVLQQVQETWGDLTKVAVPLNAALLDQLLRSGKVLNESAMRKKRQPKTPGTSGATTPTGPVFPKWLVLPPSPIPRGRFGAPKALITARPLAAAPDIGAEALVIQIIPHHNGEVFLSKLAVNENPTFFGWPFTGQTQPKKAGNPSYPQRVPDPVVNIRVYDQAGTQVIAHPNFPLNTIYYDLKSEIRITVQQNIVRNVPEYSILVMRTALADAAHDYDMDFYVPGSAEYRSYLAVCNQEMPSGGKPNPRKFGWL